MSQFNKLVYNLTPSTTTTFRLALDANLRTKFPLNILPVANSILLKPVHGRAGIFHALNLAAHNLPMIHNLPIL